MIVYPLFECLGGKELLLIIANHTRSSDSILMRFGAAAVFSLLIRQRDGAQLLSGNAQDKNVMLLLLRCIVDLEKCSRMERIAAPVFLPAIWMCLVAMILQDNMSIQLLTKGTIRRCLNLLEAAEDFKNSGDLTASQLSAFLTAGFEFLAISARKGKNVRDLLIKENVVYRTLNLMASCDVRYEQPEVVAVKGLICCLHSLSEAATNQLLAWVSANSDDRDATTIAIEVCMSALADDLYHFGQERPQRHRSEKLPTRQNESEQVQGSMIHLGNSD